VKFAPVLLRLLASALGLGLAQWTAEGVAFANTPVFVFAVLLLTLLYTLVKPLLVLLVLPLVVLTLGLGLWIVNALLVSLTATLVPGFVLAGWGSAFWAALWVSVFSVVFPLLLRQGDDLELRRRVVVRRRGFPRRDKDEDDNDVIDV
jgi:putative membrane protein